MAGTRPRTQNARLRGIAVGLAVSALVSAVWLGVFPAHSDVRLATDEIAASPFTVGLTVIASEPPLGTDDDPSHDTGPSHGIVGEGDPATYVIDIGVRAAPLADVIIHLPVPRGFALESVPDYCNDGSFIDSTELHCYIGNLEAGSHFTRAVTVTAGPGIGVDTLPIVATVTTDRGEIRVESREATVQVAPLTSMCDPHGRSATDYTTAPTGPVPADGRISGLVTSGPTESVTIVGTDRCGHAIARTITPFAGHFSFVGLLPGAYRLTLDGRAPVDLVLRPGAMAIDGVTF